MNPKGLCSDITKSHELQPQIPGNLESMGREQGALILKGLLWGTHVWMRKYTGFMTNLELDPCG